MKFYIVSALLMSLTAAVPAPHMPAAYDRRQPALKGEPPVERRDNLLNVAKPTATAPLVTGTAKSVPKPATVKAKSTGTGTAAHAHVPRATGTGTAASVHKAAPTNHNDKAIEYKFPSPTKVVADSPIVAVGHWWLQ